MEAHQVKNDSFDFRRWKARIIEVRQLIVNDYPSGCLDWLNEHDPGRVEKLKGTLEAAKAAYLEGDPGSLGKALNAYLKAHFRAFEKYRSIAGMDTEQ